MRRKTGLARTRACLLIALLLPGAARAGKYAGEFLELGIGARGLSMGRAMCSVADSPFAFFWNPAGLAHVNGVTVCGMAAADFGGPVDALGHYAHLGCSMPIGLANLALNYLRFQVQDIPVFADYPESEYTFQERRAAIEARGGAPLGHFSNVEQALYLSFAKMNETVLNFGWLYHEVPLKIPYGLNFKVLGSELYGQSGLGLGVDAGVQVLAGIEDITGFRNSGELGLAARFDNFTNTGLKWDGGTDAIRYSYVLGASWRNTTGALSWTLSHDVDYRYDITQGSGLEISYLRRIRIRAGLMNPEERWTYGAGFNLGPLDLDYAGFDHDLGRVHRMSFIYRF